MTKRFFSKFQKCKNIKGKHKNLWGVVKSAQFRSIKILKQNLFVVNKKKNQLSSFGRFLNTKQCLRNFYCNIQDKSYQHLLKRAIISKSKTIEKLLSLLESRIDSILFRSCFVNSFYMARQLVNHGFICINTKQTYSKSRLLLVGDLIEFKKNFIDWKPFLIKMLKQLCFRKYYTFVIKKKNHNKIFVNNIIKILNFKNRKITFLLKKIFKNQKFKIKKLKKVLIISCFLEINFRLLKILYIWDPKLFHLYFPLKLKYKKHKQSIFYSYNELLYN